MTEPIRHAAIGPGDTVVVVGLDTAGLLAVHLGRLAGAHRVVGIDAHRLRLQVADTLGVDTVHAAGDTPKATVRLGLRF